MSWPFEDPKKGVCSRLVCGHIVFSGRLRLVAGGGRATAEPKPEKPKELAEASKGFFQAWRCTALDGPAWVLPIEAPPLASLHKMPSDTGSYRLTDNTIM